MLTPHSKTVSGRSGASGEAGWERLERGSEPRAKFSVVSEGPWLLRGSCGTPRIIGTNTTGISASRFKPVSVRIIFVKS